MAHYRPAIIMDCDDLAPRMREQDAKEVWHSHGLTPLEALVFSFQRAEESYSIISDDGQVIGMFGVGRVTSNIGVPWLLASDELPKVAKEFIPQSKEWIDRVHERYDLLFNFVYAKNTTSIRWLKWLGFSFIRRVDDFGVHPAPFIEFAKHKGA